MAKVYWSARDLSSYLSVGFGNHHFLLIELEGSEHMQRTNVIIQGGKRFLTLAAIRRYESVNRNKNLVFQENDTDDVRSVHEKNDPRRLGNFWDYDLEKHRIQAPTAGGWAFARKLESFAYNYRKNTAKSPVVYKLFSDNCAAWVNTILKVAGVPKATRAKHCNFKGIDAGEKHLLSEKLFK